MFQWPCVALAELLFIYIPTWYLAVPILKYRICKVIQRVAAGGLNIFQVLELKILRVWLSMSTVFAVLKLKCLLLCPEKN